MVRTCHWCQKPYDSTRQSSLFCPENPNREANLKGSRLKRWQKSRKTEPVTVLALVVPSNPFRMAKEGS